VDTYLKKNQGYNKQAYMLKTIQVSCGGRKIIQVKLNRKRQNSVSDWEVGTAIRGKDKGKVHLIIYIIIQLFTNNNHSPLSQ